MTDRTGLRCCMALLAVLAGCAAPAPPPPHLAPLALAGPAERTTSADVTMDSVRAVVIVETARGHGSGFLIAPDGHLLTNHHVVAGALPLVIRLADGRRLPARVLRTDAARDTALLKIEATGLPALPIRRRPPVDGEPCVAVGTPERPERAGTVSAGKISGVERVATPGGTQALIFATALVAPGSSGGPLLDAAGNVLGITWDAVSAGGVTVFYRFIPIVDALDRLNVGLSPP